MTHSWRHVRTEVLRGFLSLFKVSMERLTSFEIIQENYSKGMGKELGKEHTYIGIFLLDKILFRLLYYVLSYTSFTFLRNFPLPKLFIFNYLSKCWSGFTQKMGDYPSDIAGWTLFNIHLRNIYHYRLICNPECTVFVLVNSNIILHRIHYIVLGQTTNLEK